MTNETKLGALIRTGQQRDAIHVAVAPVIAGERLSPGQHVGFIADGQVGVARNPIGVVDPFLKAAVAAGESFWLLLYPGTVVSLRHEWEHPSFEPSARVAVGDRLRSEEWMHEFADRNDVSYTALLHAGEHGYLNSDGYIEEVPVAFWDHWEIITGNKAVDRVGRFSCSC